MLNKVLIIVLAFMVSGCSMDEEHKTAFYNYAKDNCKGKLLSVDTWQTLGQAGYHCVTDAGKSYIVLHLHEIPVKYWEIPDAPEE
jgi:hypothetical protein